MKKWIIPTLIVGALIGFVWFNTVTIPNAFSEDDELTAAGFIQVPTESHKWYKITPKPGTPEGVLEIKFTYAHDNPRYIRDSAATALKFGKNWELVDEQGFPIYNELEQVTGALFQVTRIAFSYAKPERITAPRTFEDHAQWFRENYKFTEVPDEQVFYEVDWSAFDLDASVLELYFFERPTYREAVAMADFVLGEFERTWQRNKEVELEWDDSSYYDFVMVKFVLKQTE